MPFSCAEALFEFMHMPCGLRNAQVTIQISLDLFIMGLTLVEVLIYLDDIVVFAMTFKVFLERLEHIFMRLLLAVLMH